ncbi:chaperone protein dnaJ 72 [Argentina anserina]|uniref:chaperone protein dnaJ 72 n=1 Tax=Argentina anserina TaxID=57926 RepID=UPI00217629B9|nr:chaperone protein dnaJ 72 [Potentilla anserina]XP_050370937.1 chaperone protein dnaJ 72 [Potentilla anserina]
MGDHYSVLGLTRNASKEEIKEAFRKLAVKLHPDKHSHSSKAVRDSATLRFKQASEAYQVLIDDRKRADYNFRTSSAAYGYGYGYSRSNNRRRYASASGPSSFDSLLRYLTTRAFLLNVSVAGAFLGGLAVVNMGWDALWKIRNSGKSFEDAMKSVEKAKEQKEKL